VCIVDFVMICDDCHVILVSCMIEKYSFTFVPVCVQVLDVRGGGGSYSVVESFQHSNNGIYSLCTIGSRGVVSGDGVGMLLVSMCVLCMYCVYCTYMIVICIVFIIVE
jgi:hypothetical protein